MRLSNKDSRMRKGLRTWPNSAKELKVQASRWQKRCPVPGAATRWQAQSRVSRRRGCLSACKGWTDFQLLHGGGVGQNCGRPKLGWGLCMPSKSKREMIWSERCLGVIIISKLDRGAGRYLDVRGFWNSKACHILLCADCKQVSIELDQLPVWKNKTRDEHILQTEQ